MSSILLAAALSGAIVPIAKAPPSAADPCLHSGAELVPDLAASRFTSHDQVSLVDIGRDPARAAGTIFTLSPDRRDIATITKQANPRTNSNCLRLLVVPLDGAGAPREVDVGGEFINGDFSLRGFSVVKAGYERDNPPQWSPDGENIAFLKRVAGSTQAWIADPTGRTQARQVSFLPIDVDRLAWRQDGLGLILATRPEVLRRAQEIAREAPRGWLYDDRFNPQMADRPIPVGPIAFSYSFLSLTDGSLRDATDTEKAVLEPPPKLASKGASAETPSVAGYLAWLERKIPEGLLSPRRLVIALRDGQRKVCETGDCEGIQRLWWSDDSETLFGVQFTGWARNEMAFLRWDIAASQPERLLTTRDAVAGCLLAAREFICAREQAFT